MPFFYFSILFLPIIDRFSSLNNQQQQKKSLCNKLDSFFSCMCFVGLNLKPLEEIKHYRVNIIYIYKKITKLSEKEAKISI